VLIHTDSQYLKNSITNWIRKWKKNGWQTLGKEPVKNKDLWESLDQLVSRHKIEWFWCGATAATRKTSAVINLRGRR